MNSVVIAAGQTVSAPIPLGGTRLCGLIVEGVNGLGTLRVQAGREGQFYNCLIEAGELIETTLTADGWILFWPGRFVGVPTVRFVIETAQVSDLTITAVSRPI